MSEIEKAKAELKKKMFEIATIQGGNSLVELAKIVGSPYDPENPIPDVISAIYKTDTVDIGELYQYFVADEDTKTVTTVVNGSVTQTAVTPLSYVDLVFSTRSSEEFLVYIDLLLEGKHDMLAKKRIALIEALNRIEQYDAIQCLDAAVKTANQFSPDSGDTKLTYPKLIEMIRQIARYTQVSVNPDGSIKTNLALISGANVTEDIMLMDFDADKQRELTLRKAGIGVWIPVDEQQVTLGSPLDVIDADVAYLVAPSMGEGKETAHFVRRRVSSLDGTSESKERITIARGPILPQGANPKWAYSVGAMEQYGCTVVNSNPLVKFTK